jgi:D-cysteine desulfhydrase
LEAKPEVYDGNLLLSSILGAEIHFTAENRKGEDGEKLKTNWRTGSKCFVIPYGGSNFTGAMEFVSAAKELKEQLIEQN